MKKIFTVTLSLISFLAVGCNGKADREPKQDKQEAKQEMSSFVSISDLKKDFDSMTAWGDAKFGMTQKETANTEAFKGAEINDTYISMPYENYEFLRDDLEMSLSGFEARFKMNELYAIHIKSYSYSARHLHNIEKDAEYFVSRFSEKYGCPDYQKGDVDIFDFSAGEEFCYARWGIGDKTITISMGEDKYSSEYYYDVYIWNSKFPTKIDQEEAKELQENEERRKAEESHSF